VNCVDGWHDRVVKLDESGKLAFSIAMDPIPLIDHLLPKTVDASPIGAVFEWRADQTALELGRRVVRSTGAALVIDYGHLRSATGDTLQAVGKHGFVNPLGAPGIVDLTAHVDFQALAQAVDSMGARVHDPVEQATFLRHLGIGTRAEALKRGAPPAKAAEIDAALARLTDESPTGMGKLFKVMAVSHRSLGPLPGF
jgi:SAM-dependent MidA family methyltransferase